MPAAIFNHKKYPNDEINLYADVAAICAAY